VILITSSSDRKQIIVFVEMAKKSVVHFFFQKVGKRFAELYQ